MIKRVRLKLYLVASLLILLVLSPQVAAESWQKTELNGTNIAYQDSGLGKPQTLIFIHGWSCDSSFWRFQLPFFANDYRVIAIDLPGFGNSDKPHNIDYSLDFFAQAVHAVVDHSGVKKPVLIGHSMGYAITRQYLINYPDTVKAIVNVDGAYFRIPETEQGRATFQRHADEMLAHHKGPQRSAAVYNFINATFYSKTPEPLKEQIIQIMSSADSYAATSALDQMLKLDQWQKRTFNLPVLAIYASAQQLPDDHQAYLSSIFSDLTYHEWDDAGHYLMLEQPDRFNQEVLTYLKSLP